MLEGRSDERTRRCDRRRCDVSELEGILPVLGRERRVALVVVIEVLCLLLFPSAGAALVTSSSSPTVSSSSLALIIVKPLFEGLRGSSVIL